MDLDPIDSRLFERCGCQRGGDFGRVATIGVRGSNPIADFQGGWSSTPVQARATDDLATAAIRIGFGKDTEHRIADEPGIVPASDLRSSLVVGEWFERDPRHPWAQVFEAVVDRLAKERCFAGLPSPDDESFGLDPFRQ